MNTYRRDNWKAGINNIARPNRLPDGALRDLVNLNPGAGGILTLRAGYEKVADCTDCRFAAGVNGRVVLVDGGQVLAFENGATRQIGTVTAGADVAGIVHNGELFLSTRVESLRTDGDTVRPWGVPAPAFTLEVVPGAGSLSGRHRVAVTAVQDGVESGTDSMLVVVPPGSALRVVSGDPRALRLYASVENGETLYYQGPLIGGATAINGVSDHTETLTTDGLVPMPPCDEYVSHRGVIAGRLGRYVFLSEPMQPHLMHPVRGFLQYPADVSVLASGDTGLYVAADRTYLVTGAETLTPQQNRVLELGGVAGTAVTLEDGRAMWFSPSGPVLAGPDGVQLVSKGVYAPDTAAIGAAGVVDRDGNQMVVTTMRGSPLNQNLAAGDFAELEIGNE